MLCGGQWAWPELPFPRFPPPRLTRSSVRLPVSAKLSLQGKSLLAASVGLEFNKAHQMEYNERGKHNENNSSSFAGGGARE